MAKAVWTADQKSAIEAELERIAGSAVFTNAGRMFPLLQYLVRAELDGTATRLNQHRIAIDVLGRDQNFDPATDSIVRVDMGRLRGKLREYYATDGSTDAVVIGLPKGRYRPTLDFGKSGEAQQAPAPKQDIRFCRTRDGTNIAWSISGSGYPLIKAANWMSHLEYDYESAVWRHWWTELSRRYELIRYDERGCGLSDWNIEDVSFAVWLEDFDAVVEAAGRERFALLGVSQGASVAIDYAVRHPERVSHLILYGGFVQGRRRRDHAKDADEAKVLEELIRVGWGQTHGAFRQVFGSLFMPEGTAEQFQLFDDLQRATSSPANAERIFRVSQDIDVGALCKRVTVPTIVLHARDEIVIPFSQARFIASSIPGAKLVSLDSRNHLILEHEPAWKDFLDAVDKFVTPV